jgi:hypothetical protein
VPKIDWFDTSDNQPHWEPRPRRERASRELRDRRTRLEQIIAMAATPPALPEPPIKRPLHLIWGAPVWHTAGDAESSSGQDNG